MRLPCLCSKAVRVIKPNYATLAHGFGCLIQNPYGVFHHRARKLDACSRRDHHLGKPRFGFFNYQVIHLWDMPSQIFLEHESLSLLPLLGQSKIPRRLSKQRVKKLSNTISALAKKEWLAIMERLAYDKGLKMETPLITKIRNEGREEGGEEGGEEGRELMTLDFLNQRFDLDSVTITRLGEHFASLDMAALSAFSHTLIQLKNKREFKRLLKTL